MLWMIVLNRSSSNFLRKRRRKGGEVEEKARMEIDAPAENRHPEATKSRGRGPFTLLALCIYIVAFLTGAIVMSFEMLDRVIWVRISEAASIHGPH
jgi:hypothetical protein